MSKKKPASDTDNSENIESKKRRNRKALRNEEKKRNSASIEAEEKLSKMRTYWVCNAIWALIGIALLAIGLYSKDAKISEVAAIKVSCFIIVFSIGAAIYGARKQYSLTKKANRK